MARLKDATFEGASLTGTNGFTTTAGSPTLDSTSKIKGTYCARPVWATTTNVTGTTSGLNNAELFISFYMNWAVKPTSGTPRLVTIGNASTQYNIVMNTVNGSLNLRMNSTTLATAFLNPTVGTTYRIGIRVKVSSGAAVADSQYDLYVAVGDAAFGAAVASSTAVTMNTSNANFTNIVFGHNNASSPSGDVYFDNIRIDSTTMPTDDVVSGTNTAKTITVVVSGTPSIKRGIANTYSVVNNVVESITRGIANTYSITSNVVESISRRFGINGSVVVGIAEIVTESLPKSFAVVVGTTESIKRAIANTFNVTANSTVSIRRAITKAYTVVSTTSPTILRAISKPITIIVGVNESVNRGISRSFSVVVNAVESIGRNVNKVFTRTIPIAVAYAKDVITGAQHFAMTVSVAVTSTVSMTMIKKFFRNILAAVNTSITLKRAYTKILTITVSGMLSILKNIPKVITAVSTVQTTIERGIGKVLTAISGVQSFFTKIKTLSEVPSTQFKKNIAALTLAIKNTAINRLGKNTNTLNIEDTDNDNINW